MIILVVGFLTNKLYTTHKYTDEIEHYLQKLKTDGYNLKNQINTRMVEIV
jgi:hypothetical protein